MTICMNIAYFEEAGIRCPHCKRNQLTGDMVVQRLQLAGLQVLLVECSVCHSHSTIREKSDAPLTQDQTYAYHRYRR
jgi:hypothetical protein